MGALNQITKRIPEGVLRHKIVLRQNPPANSFTAAADTQSIFLVGLPSSHVIVGVRALLVIPFSGGGLTSCSAILGSTSNSTTNTNYYMPSFSCTQAITPQSFLYWSPFAMYTTEAQDMYATFTTTGAQLQQITAGEIEFTIMFRAL